MTVKERRTINIIMVLILALAGVMLLSLIYLICKFFFPTPTFLTVPPEVMSEMLQTLDFIKSLETLPPELTTGTFQQQKAWIYSRIQIISLMNKANPETQIDSIYFWFWVEKWSAIELTMPHTPKDLALLEKLYEKSASKVNLIFENFFQTLDKNK